MSELTPIDISLIFQVMLLFFAAIPWQFWALLAVGLVARILIDRLATRRRRYPRTGREPESRNEPDLTTLPFLATQSLLSKAERAFYDTLVASIDRSYTVCVKVRLMDLLYLPASTPHRQAY